MRWTEARQGVRVIKFRIMWNMAGKRKIRIRDGSCVSRPDRNSARLSRCSGWSKGGCSPCSFRPRRTGGPARGSAPAAQRGAAPLTSLALRDVQMVSGHGVIAAGEPG